MTAPRLWSRPTRRPGAADTCVFHDERGREHGEAHRDEIGEVVVVQRRDDEENRREDKQESSKAEVPEVHLFSFRVSGSCGRIRAVFDADPAFPR
jgi:hypothetical protein